MRPARPHQVQLIEAAWSALLGGSVGVLLQLATGGGKTDIAMHLVERFVARAEPGESVLFFAHREELVRQASDRILSSGWPVERLAIITDGRRSGLADAPFVIASIQTARRKPHLLPERIKLVFFDEARHYISADWNAVMRRYHRTVRRVGLDATPERQDGAPLRGLFDTLIPGPSVRSLIDAGYLVESRILAPAEHQDALAQDPIQAYQRHTPNGRAIVFAESVTQANELATRFTLAGVRAEVVSAACDDRSGAQARFMRGETRVLTSMGVLKEGWDGPPTDTIIHVARCNSLPEWLQRSGRGLRPSPGKTLLTVLDLHGDVRDYGLLDDEHEWSLDGPGRLREGAPGLVQCLTCFAWGRGGRRCPCGATLPEAKPRELRVSAAELEEVRRAAVAAETEDERRGLLGAWALMALRVDERRAASSVRAMYRARYLAEPDGAWMREAIESGRAQLAREAEARRAAQEPLFARRP